MVEKRKMTKNDVELGHENGKESVFGTYTICCTSSNSVSEICGLGRTSLLRFFTESGLFNLKEKDHSYHE